MPWESDRVKEFFQIISPGFSLEGEVPALDELEGIEIRPDGYAIARVRSDGRVLPVRFTFDDGRIARVEVL
jgi:hypothetical protein